MLDKLMPHAGEPDSLLRYYEALQCASQEMLLAARNGDWDSVCRLEGACTVVIEALRKAAQDKPLSPGEQKDRMRILRAILANDAEIRQLCDPLPAILDSRSFMVKDSGAALH